MEGLMLEILRKAASFKAGMDLRGGSLISEEAWWSDELVIGAAFLSERRISGSSFFPGC